MATEPEIWTTRGFLDYCISINNRMQDRSFAFILGSGASRPSGIPTGGELVHTWLAELHQRLDSDYETRSVDKWATPENIGISDFDYHNAATFYPQVFERRFRDDPEEGYAHLEAVMEGKEPSFGYSILAQVLTGRKDIL